MASKVIFYPYPIFVNRLFKPVSFAHQFFVTFNTSFYSSRVK